MVVAIIIVGLACAGTFLLINEGRASLAAAREKVQAEVPRVQKTMGLAESAETIIAQVGPIDRNIKLIAAMEAHNKDYTSLYRDILNYVPDFYRITSINAAPSGENANVNMTGVLETERQYADLALAMFRIPGVASVSRAGFTYERDYVPALNTDDQDGLKVKQGEQNLPSKPIEQMEELIRRAASKPRGFLNEGGFGTGEGPRGAMPKWSVVNISLVVARNIQTPNPRATIEQQGGGGGAAGRAGRGGANVAGFGGAGR